jgi:integration host factor subunit beta
MNRTDIVKELQDLYPKLKKVEVQNVVYNLFGHIGDELANGKRIEVRGFGSFSLKKRSAGMVRNPRHNKSIPSPERYNVYFRPGKELAERVNKVNTK